MLNSVLENYSAGLRKNIENKKKRGIDEKKYQKLLDLNDKVFQQVKQEFGI
tara:strand:+ start:188 stop:340 length:153 start_codon:yes stop_codon:yes gene_type:complete